MFNQSNPTIFNLVTLVFQVFFLAHLVGCGFHTVGKYEKSRGHESWLVSKDIQDASWERRYLYSLYYSLITMCTVGYGDISPVTDLEIIYVMIITIFCCGMFAYAVNTIGQIF